MNGNLRVIVLLLLLASCSGVEVKKLIACEGADKKEWYKEGYDTALAGKGIRSFDQHKERCGELITAEHRASYIDGYTKGAIAFCTYDKGYELGLNNFELPNTCPFEIRGPFVEGYKLGRRDYEEKIRMMERLSRDTQDDDVRDSWERGANERL